MHLDAGSEVVTLIGSKEGIAHIPLAFVNSGDVALVASPGYPVYHIGTQFAGGDPYFMDLLKENRFLPDLEAIPADVARKAKIMFINYPNNPTAAVAPKDFFESVAAFAAEYSVIVCHDAAYSEITFDGYSSQSILEVPGARERAIEFHSFSKTFSMAGWRVGFVVGSRDVVDSLRTLKSNIDSGVFGAVLLAAAETLKPEWVVKIDGKVVARSEDTINPNLPTGQVEVRVEGLEVFQVEADQLLLDGGGELLGLLVGRGTFEDLLADVQGRAQVVLLALLLSLLQQSGLLLLVERPAVQLSALTAAGRQHLQRRVR